MIKMNLDITICLKNFLDRQIPLLNPSIKEEDGNYDIYLDIVKKAGSQMVEDGKITYEVSTGLNMELLPVQEYIEYISKG
jgi:hypothetical protein